MAREEKQYVVRNLRDQPLELHLQERMVLVPGRGQVRIGAREREAAQLGVLERRRLLAVRSCTPSTDVERLGRVNVNTASAKELRELLGLSRTRAKAIIAHRRGQGPFRRREELLRVPGMDEATVESISTRIAFGG